MSNWRITVTVSENLTMTHAEMQNFWEQVAQGVRAVHGTDFNIGKCAVELVVEPTEAQLKAKAFLEQEAVAICSVCGHTRRSHSHGRKCWFQKCSCYLFTPFPLKDPEEVLPSEY